MVGRLLTVKIHRLLLLALVVAAALPSSASARTNPYTATGVCGPGYSVVDRHKLVDSNHGKLLAELVLTYNPATGKNCLVNLKRYRVGLGRRYMDWMYVQLHTRPLRVASNSATDKGHFKYYAGPIYVSARGKCVMWGGGADLVFPANHSPRGTYHSSFLSRWSHCG